MNPFTLNYHPEFFCDREEQLKQLKENIINGRNTLIHSPRRLGKSALIRHLFHLTENEGNYETLFVDLFATQNMEDFIRIFAEKILEKYHRKNIFEGIKNVLRGLSPVLNFNEDGTPSLSLTIQESQEASTLRQLFSYLESRNKKVIVAFDEFQEIANYPQQAEAILRTHIQELNNLQFIFSGSSNHLLSEMFYSAKRPFYQSSEVMVLNKIKKEKYSRFISNLFKLGKKEIEPKALISLLEFADVYTYYVQVIFNQAYYKADKILTESDAKELAKMYIENRKADYHGLLSLLSANQAKLVIAIANEEIVKAPTSIQFIIKHNLPSVSSSLQAVKALADKEIVYKSDEGYIVYDVFFKRFLQAYYH